MNLMRKLFSYTMNFFSVRQWDKKADCFAISGKGDYHGKEYIADRG